MSAEQSGNGPSTEPQATIPSLVKADGYDPGRYFTRMDATGGSPDDFVPTELNDDGLTALSGFRDNLHDYAENSAEFKKGKVVSLSFGAEGVMTGIIRHGRFGRARKSYSVVSLHADDHMNGRGDDSVRVEDAKIRGSGSMFRKSVQVDEGSNPRTYTFSRRARSGAPAHVKSDSGNEHHMGSGHRLIKRAERVRGMKDYFAANEEQDRRHAEWQATRAAKKAQERLARESERNQRQVAERARKLANLPPPHPSTLRIPDVQPPPPTPVNASEIQSRLTGEQTVGDTTPAKGRSPYSNRSGAGPRVRTVDGATNSRSGTPRQPRRSNSGVASRSRRKRRPS